MKLPKSHCAFRQMRHITVLCTQAVTVASPIAGRVNALRLHTVNFASWGAAVSHSVTLPCITILHTSRGSRTAQRLSKSLYIKSHFICQKLNTPCQLKSNRLMSLRKVIAGCILRNTGIVWARCRAFRTASFTRGYGLSCNLRAGFAYSCNWLSKLE
jgi:hypothetical protein